MDRRHDDFTAQHIRNAQAAKWRVNRQALARELLRHGVSLATAARVLATPRHRDHDPCGRTFRILDKAGSGNDSKSSEQSHD
jgi:hypothetical protein